MQAIEVRGPGEAVLYSKLFRIYDRKLRLKRGLQRVEIVPPACMHTRAVVDWAPFDPDTEDVDASSGAYTVTIDGVSAADEEEDAMFAGMPHGADNEYFRLLKLKEKCVAAGVCTRRR